MKDKDKAVKEIFKKVDNILSELEEINREYDSWDEWDKTEIISKAKSILLDGFKTEIERRRYGRSDISES